MDITSLIAPWLTLLVILIPLIYAERWIHQHMYGVGYLLTLDKAQATGFYYLIFFPGVLVHEVIQWLIAGVLNVPIKKINSYPKPQENGTIRYDFVVIEKTTRFKAMLIGGLPFVIAGAIVYFISTSILELDALLVAIGTGDLNEIGNGIQEFLKTPDVWLWLYFMFSISNGMIPTKEDQQGWFLILGAGAAITIALTVLGFDVFVTTTLSGPVTHALELVITALSAILFIDVVFGMVLGLTEDALARWRGQKMDYNAGRQFTKKKEAQREPGSNIPLPKGTPIPTIYQLDLPVPPLPAKRPEKSLPASPAHTSPVRPAPSTTSMFGRATGTTEEKPTAVTPALTDSGPNAPEPSHPPARPSFQSSARPPFAEKPAEPTRSEAVSEEAESPASPGRPSSPAFPSRMPPNLEPERATSAVAPFRRSGADEHGASPAINRDHRQGRPIDRPGATANDPAAPRKPSSPSSRLASPTTGDDEDASRVMDRHMPESDSNEVQ